MGLRKSGSTVSSTKAVGKAAVRALKKAEKGAAKQQRRARKKAGRTAGEPGSGAAPATAERTTLSSAQLKRMIGVGTTVVPLLAPYALAAATAARGRWDAYRAARLGVGTDQLAAFSGPGGSLHARLSHLAEALAKLDGPTTAPASAASEFVTVTRPRLTDLSVAVRAAEQMPATRRRTAFRAISGELDGIELTLLQHLGVASG